MLAREKQKTGFRPLLPEALESRSLLSAAVTVAVPQEVFTSSGSTVFSYRGELVDYVGPFAVTPSNNVAFSQYYRSLNVEFVKAPTRIPQVTVPPVTVPEVPPPVTVEPQDPPVTTDPNPVPVDGGASNTPTPAPTPPPAPTDPAPITEPIVPPKPVTPPPIILAPTIADVTTFGAKGDGVTDDTAAIQSAVKTGLDVYFPATTRSYVVSLSIYPRDGQRLYGDGDSSLITSRLANMNTMMVYGRTDVVVEKLFIRNEGTTNTGSFGNAISIAGASSHTTVQNCRLEGTQGGVVISDGDDSIITGNRITATSKTYQDSWDIAIRGRGVRNQITENECIGGGNVGILLQTAKLEDRVDDNVVKGNRVGAHAAYGIAVYRVDNTAGLERNIVEWNTVTDISGSFQYLRSATLPFGAGIYIQGAEHSTVSFNTVTNSNSSTTAEMLAPGGIGLNGVRNCIVASNTVRDGGWYGIMVASSPVSTTVSDQVLIKKNVLSGNGKDAIRLNQASHVEIDSNQIDGVAEGFNGIFVNNSTVRDDITIHGNLLLDSSNNGILVTSVRHLDIVDNLVNHAGVHGILVSNSSDVLVEHNRVTDYGLRGICLLEVTNAEVTVNYITSTVKGATGLIYDPLETTLSGNMIFGNELDLARA